MKEHRDSLVLELSKNVWVWYDTTAFLNVKEPEEPGYRQGVVYKLSLASDCQASYIGGGGRNFNAWLNKKKQEPMNVKNRTVEHHWLSNLFIGWSSHRPGKNGPVQGRLSSEATDVSRTWVKVVIRYKFVSRVLQEWLVKNR